jgi:hypothetical protein
MDLYMVLPIHKKALLIFSSTMHDNQAPVESLMLQTLQFLLSWHGMTDHN